MELDNYPLGTQGEPSFSSTPPPEREGASRAVAVIAVALVLIAAVVAFFVVRPSRQPATSATENAAPKAPAETARGPLGGAAEERELPPLDLSDPAVRELLKGLSSRPELAAWLATDNLIRGFVASVDNVANGNTPAAHLQSLKPSRPFVVKARNNDQLVIDPASYKRYDGIGDTVSTLDANGLARAYTTLRPRLQEAYHELGYPDGNFDDAVERAIRQLVRAPVIQEEAPIQPSPVLYKFTNERIEQLTAAQKQLLRMGPRNQRLVQDKLREVAAALGIPAERLR